MDWFPTSGSIRHFFDDVLIAASRSLKQNLLERVGSFGLNQVASYSPEYFSGYNAEVYTVDLDDAHTEARRHMDYNLEEMARQDVLRHYDEVRAVSVRANYSDETYKHVMLPVYATAYTYKGKEISRSDQRSERQSRGRLSEEPGENHRHYPGHSGYYVPDLPVWHKQRRGLHLRDGYGIRAVCDGGSLRRTEYYLTG